MYQTLGPAGCSGGVHDEQGVFSVKTLRLVHGRRALDRLVPPHVAPTRPWNWMRIIGLITRAAHHDDGLHMIKPVYCRVDNLFDTHRFAAPELAIGGNYGFGTGMSDKKRKCVVGKP